MLASNSLKRRSEMRLILLTLFLAGALLVIACNRKRVKTLSSDVKARNAFSLFTGRKEALNDFQSLLSLQRSSFHVLSHPRRECIGAG